MDEEVAAVRPGGEGGEGVVCVGDAGSIMAGLEGVRAGGWRRAL